MKKRIIVFVLFVLFVFSLPALQETYSGSEKEFKDLQSLASMAKVVLPKMTTPISGDQMKSLLEMIPYDNLDSSAKTLYAELEKKLQRPDYSYAMNEKTSFILRPEVSLAGYLNKVDKPLEESMVPYKDRLPLANIAGGIWFGDYSYGEIDFELIASYDHYAGKKGKFVSNLLNGEGENTQPHKAYMSFGYDNINLIVGRDRLSAGSGVTGNLGLGDTRMFDDFAKLSVVSVPFSYDFTVATYDLNADYDSDPIRLKPYDMNSAHNIVAIHRFSATFFKRYNLSLFEGVLQYGQSLGSDMKMLNPFMMFHNTMIYRNGSQNNFFGVEFGFNIARGLDLNIQFIADQLQLSTELNNGNPADSTAPNAYGLLVNLEGSFLINDEFANWYIEGAYTSPALYLKEDNGHGSTLKHYDVDLIVGNALWSGKGDLSYLGYKYGPDSIVGAAGFSFTPFKGFDVSADARYICHGEHGIRFRENQKDCNGTGYEAFYMRTPSFTEGQTKPEHRVELVIGTEYRPLDWLKFNVDCGLISAFNYHNIPNEKNFDIQVAFSGTIDVAKPLFNMFR